MTLGERADQLMLLYQDDSTEKYCVSRCVIALQQPIIDFLETILGFVMKQ